MSIIDDSGSNVDWNLLEMYQDPKSMPYNYGKITVEKAVQILKNYSDGFALLRESTTRPGVWTVSLKKENQVQHIRLLNLDNLPVYIRGKNMLINPN